MRSKWIAYKGRRIFYQDFSGYNCIDPGAVGQELAEVQAVVLQEPLDSMLVLADFRDTQVGKDLMDLLTASSLITKAHIKKTAVLGVSGPKRILASMLISLTGQQLSLFETPELAQEWLTE
jgi:hypothetical protein